MSVINPPANVPDFGWPFCSGFGDRNEAFGRSYRTFCAKKNADPLFLIPAHSAPMDMEYYRGGLFKDLEGALLMTWHGHRRAVAFSLVAYPTDDRFAPIVADSHANPFVGLLKGKNRSGKKIRPVGVTSDHLGRIWFVDDRSKRLYMVTRAAGTGESDEAGEPKPLVLTEAQRLAFAEIYRDFSQVENCSACHQEMLGRRPFDTLDNLITKGWLRKESEPGLMPFIGSLDGGSEHFRPMPPAPDKPFSEVHPQIYWALYNWAMALN